MVANSVYLDKLDNSEIYLDSPMPLEVTGKEGNFVATWLEGNVDGEGADIATAVDDAKNAIVTLYLELREKSISSTRLSDSEDRTWAAILHYIGEVGKTRSGDNYSVGDPSSPDYKGPFYG